MRILEQTLRVGFVLLALCGAAAAQSIPVGFLSWDLVFPGNAGEFDFTNLTGPNGVALSDPSLFPITSTVNLTSLTLVVNFADGSSMTYLPSAVPPYFSPDPDGESLDGTAIPIAGTSPLPTSATLTGSFTPTTVTLAGGGSATISPTFTVTISPDTGNSSLADGDYGVIFASLAQAPQTISVTTAAPASAVYGSSFSVAATASSGLTVAIATSGSCSGSGGGSATITMTSGTGACSVTFNQAGNSSYLAATQVTESVTASKAVLTATANNVSRAVGAANPALTYEITGFVGKDTSAVVGGTATLTTTAMTASPASTYPITFSTEGLTATNYSFTYVPGTLTLTTAVSCTTIDYSKGFTSTGLSLNGSAKVVGGALQLTDGNQSEAGSGYFSTQVPVSSFVTDFTFQLVNPEADGITFVIQAAGPHALGGVGGGLGYAGMPHSDALKFDLHNNSGEGANSVGLYNNGAFPGVPALSLDGTGVDLHSGHVFEVHVAYDGTTAELTLTDTVTKTVLKAPPMGNIAEIIGSKTAYFGFTGATGNLTATQKILSWTYSSGSGCPSAP